MDRILTNASETISHAFTLLFFLKSIACFANHYFDSSLSAREWVDIKSSERRRSGGEDEKLVDGFTSDK